MDMIPVDSKAIESIGHDGADTLRVQYKNGGLYDFNGVHPAEVNAILQADSAGKYLNSLGIKGEKVKADDFPLP